MAEPPPSLSDSDNAPPLRSGPLGVLALLSVGLVVAFLYFARDVIVPIALAVLLSFLLAPAVRWLRRWHVGRVTAVVLTVLIAFLVMFGFAAVVVQEISSLAQQLPEYRLNLEAQDSLAAGGHTRWRSLAPCNNNAAGTRQGTEAIRKPEF